MKKILSMICAFAIMASTWVSAASYTDMPKDSEAIEVLSSLGVIAGYEDGTVKPDQLITRAETATLIVNALNMKSDAESSAGTSQFADVNADSAWAAGFVNVGVAQGFISGYDNETFGPLDNVTYEQLCKMLVCITGYGDYAAVNGGWPTGYTSIAGQLGINNKVVTASAAELTRGQVFQMIYNALTTPMLGVYEYSMIGNTYTQLDGKNGREFKTLLSEKFGGYVANITITGTPVSAGLENDEVQFTVTKADYWPETEESITSSNSYPTDALFVNVDVNNNHLQTGKAVFVENEDEELVMIYFAPNGRTDTIEVSANTYVMQDKLTNTNKFESNNKIRFSNTYYKLAESVTVYVNGADYGNLSADNIDTLIGGAQGMIKLVKDNNANYYNAIFVNYYQIAKVTSVDVEDDEIVISLANTKNALTTEFDEIVITTEAVEEGNVVVNVSKNGEVSGLDEIVKGDIIAYAIDFVDATEIVDPKTITILATNDMVSGTVTKIDVEENEYTINDTIYAIHDGVSIALKNTVDAKLDPFGKIYSTETNATADKYAIILKTNTSDDTVTMLLPNGKVVTYACDVDFDDDATLKDKIVTYTIKNSTKTITSITPATVIEDKKVTVIEDKFEYRSRNNNNKLGNHEILNSTSVINATKIKEDKDNKKASNYSIFDVDNFINGTEYKAIIVKTGTYTNLVVITEIGTILNEESRFAIALSNPKEHYTDDDDECWLVEAFYNGEIVELLFEDKKPAVSEETIFFFETDSDGFSKVIEVAGSIDETEWTNDITNTRASVIFTDELVVVVDIDDNSITFAKATDVINTNEDLEDSSNGIITYGIADDMVSYVYDMGADAVDYEDMVKVKSPKASKLDNYEGENENKGIYTITDTTDLVMATVLIVNGDVVAIYSVVR